MAAITYPASLPPPAPGMAVQRAEGRAVAEGGNPLARARARDFGATVQATWLYTSAQMATWVEWYETEVRRTLWFSVQLKGHGGYVPRVARYLQVSKAYLGAGLWRVQAELELRGASVAPGTVITTPVTWSPVYKGPLIALSNGNLTATDLNEDPSDYASVRATVAVTSGQWYWEIAVDSLDNALDLFIGVIAIESPNLNDAWERRFVDVLNSPRYAYRAPGTRYDDSATNDLPTYGAGDVIGIAWKPAQDKIWYAKNGTWVKSGDPAADLNPTSTGQNPTAEAMSPGMGYDNNPGFGAVTARFAAGSWGYPAPAGFIALQG